MTTNERTIPGRETYAQTRRTLGQPPRQGTTKYFDLGGKVGYGE